jgi:hypothetical protein
VKKSFSSVAISILCLQAHHNIYAFETNTATTPMVLFEIPIPDSGLSGADISISDDQQYIVATKYIVDLKKREVAHTLDQSSGSSVIVGESAYSLLSSGKTVNVYDLDSGKLVTDIELAKPAIKGIYHPAIFRNNNGTVYVLGSRLMGEDALNYIYRVDSRKNRLIDNGYDTPAPSANYSGYHFTCYDGYYSGLQPAVNHPGNWYLMGSFLLKCTTGECPDPYLATDLITYFETELPSRRVVDSKQHDLEAATQSYNLNPVLHDSLNGYSKQCGSDLWMLTVDQVAPGNGNLPGYNSLTRVNVNNFKKTSKTVLTHDDFTGFRFATWTADCRYAYLFGYEITDKDQYLKSFITQFDTLTSEQVSIEGNTYPIGGEGYLPYGYQSGVIADCGGDDCLLAASYSVNGVRDTIEAIKIPWSSNTNNTNRPF